MPTLKEIHERIRAKRKERKEVTDVYRDLLAQSQQYQKVLEEMTALRAKKAQLERAILSECAKEMEQKERISLDMKTDMQMLSDLAMSILMKGETVELVDEYDIKYEPVFKVTFKKAS